MHFSTMTGEALDSARLTTRRMTPGGSCNVQCLQFYYYYNGNDTDLLNIWIREFDSEEDTQGRRRLMGQITGNVSSVISSSNSPNIIKKCFILSSSILIETVRFESRAPHCCKY